MANEYTNKPPVRYLTSQKVRVGRQETLLYLNVRIWLDGTAISSSTPCSSQVGQSGLAEFAVTRTATIGPA